MAKRQLLVRSLPNKHPEKEDYFRAEGKKGTQRGEKLVDLLEKLCSKACICLSNSGIASSLIVRSSDKKKK